MDTSKPVAACSIIAVFVGGGNSIDGGWLRGQEYLRVPACPRDWRIVRQLPGRPCAGVLCQRLLAERERLRTALRASVRNVAEMQALVDTERSHGQEMVRVEKAKLDDIRGEANFPSL